MSEDILSVDQFLGVTVNPVKRVYIKAWDRHVFLRLLDGHEHDAYEMYVKRNDNKLHPKNRLIQLCVTDADGNRLFDDKNTSFQKLDGAGLTEVYRQAMLFNGWTGDDIAAVDEELSEAGKKS